MPLSWVPRVAATMTKQSAPRKRKNLGRRRSKATLRPRRCVPRKWSKCCDKYLELERVHSGSIGFGEDSYYMGQLRRRILRCMDEIVSEKGRADMRPEHVCLIDRLVTRVRGVKEREEARALDWLCVVRFLRRGGDLNEDPWVAAVHDNDERFLEALASADRWDRDASVAGAREPKFATLAALVATTSDGVGQGTRDVVFNALDARNPLVLDAEMLKNVEPARVFEYSRFSDCVSVRFPRNAWAHGAPWRFGADGIDAVLSVASVVEPLLPSDLTAALRSRPPEIIEYIWNWTGESASWEDGALYGGAPFFSRCAVAFALDKGAKYDISTVRHAMFEDDLKLLLLLLNREECARDGTWDPAALEEILSQVKVEHRAKFRDALGEVLAR